MKVHNAIIVKEELINIAALTKLVNNYCSTYIIEEESLPIESLLIEINIIKPEIISVDLKPLIMAEVILAVSKIVKKIEKDDFIDLNISSEVDHLNLKSKLRGYVAIASIDEISFLKMEDIMFCKADGRYTRFYLANGTSCMSSRNIGDYEDRILDESCFFRIHNSYIINMRFVARINKREGISCEMINGLSIPISKRRQDDFSKFMGLKM
jgi:two-component system LytT family response regulator